MAKMQKKGDYDTKTEIRCEFLWMKAGRPYYRLYPGIIIPFLKLDLNKVDTGVLKMPVSTLMVQLPVNSIVSNDTALRNILLWRIAENDQTGFYAMLEYSKVGVSDDDHQNIFTASFALPFKSGRMLGTMLGGSKTVNGGMAIPVELQDAALKIAAVCMLLGDDPQIIQPDVLSKDYEKWKIELDPKYVEKAKRRGKFGWVIGKDIEVAPHMRAASPLALYWTGKGRTVPIIRYRKGCIVHRELVEKIPTGFEG
jgi:hypothetical protein